MCSSGNMPAQATANSVMASANRLMELRQRWLSSSRMAEISVPAWPIPIHHTKLVMAKPHITGVRMPQMPTPLTSSNGHGQQKQQQQRRGPTAKPANQNSGVCLVSTTLGNLVGDRAEGVPGRDDLAPVPARSATTSVVRPPCVANPQSPGWDCAAGQVSGARPRIQIGQHAVVPLLGFHLATRGCSGR